MNPGVALWGTVKSGERHLVYFENKHYVTSGDSFSV